MADCCFIANSSWYLYNFRASTIRVFSQANTVTCLSPKGEDQQQLLKLGADVKTFYLDAGSINPFKEFLSLFTIFWYLFRNRPKIVFSFNPKTNLYAMICCQALGIKCVPNVSGVGVASELKGLLGIFYRKLTGFCYRRAHHVFFQNKNDHLNFLLAGWIDSKNAEIIPGSGVDLKRFTPHPRKGKIRFLMASRLIKQKGVVEYIQSARQVLLNNKSCDFLLAGVKDFSNRAIDDNTINSLESEEDINFIGHIKDMPELLKEVDCIVLPSYYPEGVPRSLIEAASSGKIIITTNTPGCKETVLNGINGYLVEPRSIDQLTQAMDMVCNLTIEEMFSMKQASRNIAELHFDENIVINKYKSVASCLKFK